MGGFDQAQQRLLLDRYGSITSEAAASALDGWREICERLNKLESDEQERIRQADLWLFQKREIESADLKQAEDQALETERRVLANAEKIYAAAMTAHDLLYESGSSAEAALRSALRNLDELARYDGSFAEAVEQLSSARAVVGDVSVMLRDYAGKIHASPARLAEIEDRLAVLDRLKRKYGKSLEEVIAYGVQVREYLAEIENRDQLLEQLRAARQKAEEGYRAAAAALTAERKAAAAKLEKLAQTHINDLALKARFAIEVTPRDEQGHWGRHGWDLVECRIATNAGEPLKPLHEVASGGEMSRIMLALKVSVEEGQGKRRKIMLPRTLVFDEIDIGIGGRAAEAVGQKLKTLSRAQQVLCVTHLPQIAAFAGQHLVVEKKEQQGRTKTSVRLLGGSERIEEVARMLSGAKLTETSLRHAEQMIKASQGSSTKS